MKMEALGSHSNNCCGVSREERKELDASSFREGKNWEAHCGKTTPQKIQQTKKQIRVIQVSGGLGSLMGLETASGRVHVSSLSST